MCKSIKHASKYCGFSLKFFKSHFLTCSGNAVKTNKTIKACSCTRHHSRYTKWQKTSLSSSSRHLAKDKMENTTNWIQILLIICYNLASILSLYMFQQIYLKNSHLDYTCCMIKTFRKSIYCYQIQTACCLTYS